MGSIDPNTIFLYIYIYNTVNIIDYGLVCEKINATHMQGITRKALD